MLKPLIQCCVGLAAICLAFLMVFTMWLTPSDLNLVNGVWFLLLAMASLGGGAAALVYGVCGFFGISLERKTNYEE